jgi:hypothetical protein
MNPRNQSVYTEVERDNSGKLELPETLYKEMLSFFRRTSLPRMQRQRQKERNALSGQGG